MLVVNPSFAAHSVADVIAMAKANPGKINFGTGGVGTTPHMAAELFQHDAGIKMVHVAYRGEAGAINDLVAGQIPLMFANLSAVMGQIKGGTLRAHRGDQRAALALGARRSDGGGDIAGLCGRNLVRHRRAGRNAARTLSPSSTPRRVQALASDDTKKRFADLGMTNSGAGSTTPEELDAYIKSEIAKWSKVIEDANIQPMD